MVRSAAIAEVQATLRGLPFIGSQKGSRITVHKGDLRYLKTSLHGVLMVLIRVL